jgi:hypothetical protein
MPKEPFLIIEPIIENVNWKTERIEGMVNVSIGGRSDILINILATAMETHPEIELVVVYAHDLYNKRQNKKARKKKKGEPIQGELFHNKK